MEQENRIYSLDVLGVEDPGENDQLDVHRDFQENVTKTDEGRYQVNVPWIPGSTLSNNNLEPSRKRLHNVKHNKKLCNLLNKSRPDSSGSSLKDKWVLNLSSKELSELERRGLEKGLKFAIAPNKIPTAEIIASVEEGIFRLDDDQKHLVRAEVSSILRRAKPPPKNISSNVFKALISLKKDPDRLVLSADKDNCVVVMDKHQYREKALSLLNDRNTYSILKSDPTGKTQRKLNKMLLNLKKAGIVDEFTYKMLYSSDGLSPRFYGLPKIHKAAYCLIYQFSDL